MLQYRTKVKAVIIVGIVLAINLTSYIAGHQRQRHEAYEFRINVLETELQEVKIAKTQIETEYREKLMTIVTTVYEREHYSMGGYETPQGAGVTEVYEAILNEVQDYRSMLEQVDNYFDNRKEYVQSIPSIWPVELNDTTRITSGFGWRMSPITGKVSFHAGIDIAGVWNSKIIATADGVVKSCWPPPDDHWQGHPLLGGMVKIEHAGGFMTIYGHMKKVLVIEGTQVKRGDVIGIMGDTGTSKGRHLHYTLQRNGVAENPLDYLQF